MVAVEAAFSLFSSRPSTSPLLPLCPNSSPAIRLRVVTSSPSIAQTFSLRCSLRLPSTTSIARKSGFELRSAVQEAELEETAEKTQPENQRRKLYVANLPWSLTVAEIKNTFGECGTVSDVEIIKYKDGKSRTFVFVTMASGDEAQAVIDKFDSKEISGRTIKVEYAKRFKRLPPSPPVEALPPRETRHRLYVSNLAWKVRSSHLREFFSTDFNPVSARVIFDAPLGRSGGYGFVSFATREEAESAISALDGKELMGRPMHLKFSERNVDESEKEDKEASEEEPEES